MDAMMKRAVKEIKKYAVMTQITCPVTKLVMDMRRVVCLKVRVKGGEKVYTLWVDKSYADSTQWARAKDRFDSVEVVPDDKLLEV